MAEVGVEVEVGLLLAVVEADYQRVRWLTYPISGLGPRETVTAVTGSGSANLAEGSSDAAAVPISAHAYPWVEEAEEVARDSTYCQVILGMAVSGSESLLRRVRSPMWPAVPPLE